MKGWLDAMLANLIIIYGAAIAVIGVLAAALAVKHWWSSNPFHYPYLYIDFDVSGKRNPDPYDYFFNVEGIGQGIQLVWQPRRIGRFSKL